MSNRISIGNLLNRGKVIAVLLAMFRVFGVGFWLWDWNVERMIWKAMLDVLNRGYRIFGFWWISKIKTYTNFQGTLVLAQFIC
jgi:hypothetical protein